MDRTLTIRLGKAQDDALTARARAHGKTRSEVVRELIEQAVTDEPLGRRARRLKGRVELPRSTSGWPLRDRNWR